MKASMYCVKCRQKRDVEDPEEVTMKNGKPALRAKCPVCNTGMYKIGGAKKS
jgi:Zn finger protein HypA/HybF involved in hydrogenase expression